MITQKEILTIAQGASASATGYVLECLGIDLDAPLSTDQSQALMLSLMLTLVLIETTLKGTIRNPAARDQVRATVEDLARRISEDSGLTRPDGPGTIFRVDGK